MSLSTDCRAFCVPQHLSFFYAALLSHWPGFFLLACFQLQAFLKCSRLHQPQPNHLVVAFVFLASLQNTLNALFISFASPRGPSQAGTVLND